jgi:hypothetical protein
VHNTSELSDAITISRNLSSSADVKHAQMPTQKGSAVHAAGLLHREKEKKQRAPCGRCTKTEFNFLIISAHLHAPLARPLFCPLTNQRTSWGIARLAYSGVCSLLIRFLGSRPPSKYYLRWRSPSIIPRPTKDISLVKNLPSQDPGSR